MSPREADAAGLAADAARTVAEDQLDADDGHDRCAEPQSARRELASMAGRGGRPALGQARRLAGRDGSCGGLQGGG